MKAKISDPVYSARTACRRDGRMLEDSKSRTTISDSDWSRGVVWRRDVRRESTVQQ